jgi:hypothetical protein
MVLKRMLKRFQNQGRRIKQSAVQVKKYAAKA